MKYTKEQEYEILTKSSEQNFEDQVASMAVDDPHLLASLMRKMRRDLRLEKYQINPHPYRECILGATGLVILWSRGDPSKDMKLLYSFFATFADLAVDRNYSWSIMDKVTMPTEKNLEVVAVSASQTIPASEMARASYVVSDETDYLVVLKDDLTGQVGQHFTITTKL